MAYRHERVNADNQSTGSYNLPDTFPVRAKFFNDLVDDFRRVVADPENRTLASGLTLTTPTLTTPKVNVINEATSAAGVTIDSVVLKDGDVKVTDCIEAQGTPNAQTTAVTLTGANILTKIITATHAAGATQAYTLPLGSAMETALASRLAVDQAIDFVLINLSSAATDTVTITTNTGWTLVGNMVVANLTSARFIIRKTATNTFTLYRT